MQGIKLLVRSFRRLRLFFCGFLRGKPPLGMLLGLRKSRRIQNQPQVLCAVYQKITLLSQRLNDWHAS